MKLIIDSFAGGGGASTGIEMALGRSPDIAINHDEDALSMHAANHPDTRHLSKNIWQVDPLDEVGKQPVGLLWMSPDCTHFSKARGGKPVKKNIRDLAWVSVLWAQRVKPDVIILENVEEWKDWGPLTLEGQPDQDLKGTTFQKWKRSMQSEGYKVEMRELRGCDYGDGTIRKRLFVICRCDGKPIVWPEPTHGPEGSGLLPYVTAADHIDWSLPCPSIFDTSEAIKEKYGLRAIRPLADNTLKRVARGVQRYVIDDPAPFIVPITQTSNNYVEPVDEPLRTITTAKGGERMLAIPYLSNVANSKTTGRGPNVWNVREPLRTVTSNPGFTLIAPSLVSYYGPGQGSDDRSSSVEKPLLTQTTENRHALISSSLVSVAHGDSGGRREYDITDPLNTVSATNNHALVSAFLAQHNGGPRNENSVGRSAQTPLSTIVSRATQQQLVSASMISLKGSDRRQASVEAPLNTVCAGGTHAGLISAFLTKYYTAGNNTARVDEPMHTITPKDRMNLVTVNVAGAPYVIADIGMRMLTPRELFNCQGFPPDYIIDRGHDGRIFTKTTQVSKCGNSVCPNVASALVSANCGHLRRERVAA